MADFQFNVAKGRAVELYNRVKNNDPANAAFVVVLIKVGEAQAAMEDHDDLAALLAAAGNTEADFTNYARVTLTDVEIAALPAPDDANNRRAITLPNQVYTAAGGATNNNLVAALICYDSDTTGGTDANIVPLFHNDYVVTTQGIDMDLKFPAELFQAS
ncbi:MAG: hypothetical protein AB9Q19_12550 [Candidatus Reddybacter sp.]